MKKVVCKTCKKEFYVKDDASESASRFCSILCEMRYNRQAGRRRGVVPTGERGRR